LEHQNNFVEVLKIMNDAAKNFDILATSLSFLRNYFEFNKIIFLLYPAKMLDLLAKLFFPCIIQKEKNR